MNTQSECSITPTTPNEALILIKEQCGLLTYEEGVAVLLQSSVIASIDAKHGIMLALMCGDQKVILFHSASGQSTAMLA